jgi:hypothetical protein
MKKSDETLRLLGKREAAFLLDKPVLELEARRELRRLQTAPGRRRKLQNKAIATKALLAAIKKNKPRRGVKLWKQADAMEESVNKLLQAAGWPKVTTRQIFYRLCKCPEVFT